MLPEGMIVVAALGEAETSCSIRQPWVKTARLRCWYGSPAPRRRTMAWRCSPRTWVSGSFKSCSRRPDLCVLCCPPARSQPLIRPNCAAEVSGEGRFCSWCGTELAIEHLGHRPRRRAALLLAGERPPLRQVHLDRDEPRTPRFRREGSGTVRGRMATQWPGRPVAAGPRPEQPRQVSGTPVRRQCRGGLARKLASLTR